MDLITDNNTPVNYTLLNRDVEWCCKYFDVVPDGNLYTMDDTPIFAIRMRPMGIKHIMDMYDKKYGFHTEVLTYKLNSHQYTLYSSNSKQMYVTQEDSIIRYFDFSQCKNKEFRGIIIVITNAEDRMIHAIPYIYGMMNGKRKLIFLDPYFEPDLGSGCVIGADFFYKKYQGEINCYCHGETIQADHHSCGIIACDVVKNCLKNKAKIVHKILDNVVMRKEVQNHEGLPTSFIYIYNLPIEIRKFSQLNTTKAKDDSLAESKTEEETQHRWNWFVNHLRILIYRRDPEPYNPNGELMPKTDGCKKQINTSLLEKGHKYAEKIIKDTKQPTEYSARYWLSLIKEQGDEHNIIKSLIRRARRLVAKNNSTNNQTVV